MIGREDLRRELQTPPPKFKDTIPDMSDEELVALCKGKNVQKRRLAEAELSERHPDIDVPKAIQIIIASEGVDTEPTEGRKNAGNYKKGHIRLMGLPISIENPAGSMRRGQDRDGQPP